MWPLKSPLFVGPNLLRVMPHLKLEGVSEGHRLDPDGRVTANQWFNVPAQARAERDG